MYNTVTLPNTLSCSSCWFCKTMQASANTLFCSTCHKIQELKPLKDAFALLNLQPDFNIDLKTLESNYLKLTQALHPDRFSQASTREKLFATQQTAQINDAYSKLADPVERGYHLMRLKGFSGLLANEITTHDPELLMEVMEAREALEYAETPAKIEGLIQSTQNALKATYEVIMSTLAANHFELARTNLYRYRYYVKFIQDTKQKLSKYN
jgi:Fe-S protein assembly co-chaperone HscB